MHLVCAPTRELRLKQETKMRHQLTAIALLLTAGFLFGSCLGHDDDSVDYSFYNDAAVTAFSINTLTKTSHTTSSTGEDSTYTESYTATAYKFYIDHEKALIYNPDSLPYSTNVDKVLATISSKNSGVLTFQDLVSQQEDGAATYTYYSSTDSIDFSQPRILRVWALNGQAWRDYTVKVNVHQEPADTMRWYKMSTISELSQMQHLKIVAVGDSHLILAGDGAKTLLWSGGTDGTSWAVSNTEFGADAWKNAVVKGDELYIFDNGKVLKMNGTEWTTTTPDKELRQLVAGAATELYAIAADGKLMVSVDDGATWNEELLDDDISLLPTDNYSYTARALRTNNELLRIGLFGTNATSNYAVAWTKIIDTTNAALNDGWSFVDAAGDTRYVAPKLQGLTVVDYDDTDYAFGQADDGTMSTPLRSLDGGITWKASTAVTFPEIATGMPFSITKDDDNFLWIVDKDGQIWRGRINRLGWKA